jgi:hypothetical protein
MSKLTSFGVAAAIAAAVGGITHEAHADDLRTLSLEPSVEKPQGPSAMLVTSGIVLFGVPYAFSVVSAATSDVSSDKWLYVPVVGPWGDFISRITCEPTGCRGNVGPAALPLVLAGLGQAAGIGVLIKALVDPPGSSIKAAQDTHVHVAPTSYAGGGGLQAYGKF